VPPSVPPAEDRLMHSCHTYLQPFMSLPQSAALGRQARPSVPFSRVDFGCWLGRRVGGGVWMRAEEHA
jgi:hypothetical protein